MASAASIPDRPISPRRIHFISGVMLGALLAACQAWAQAPQAPEAASGRTEKRLVVAHRHMVVAAHPLAAEAGRAVLNAGGNALDAAIATQLVLGVVEPQSSGLGG